MILADRSDYFGQGKGKIDHKNKIIPVDELMPIIEDIGAISCYNIVKDYISGNYNASAFGQMMILIVVILFSNKLMNIICFQIAKLKKYTNLMNLFLSLGSPES